MSAFPGPQDSNSKKAGSRVTPSHLTARKIKPSRARKSSPKTRGTAAGRCPAPGATTPMWVGCAFGENRTRNFDGLTTVIRPAGRVSPSGYSGEYLVAAKGSPGYSPPRKNVGRSPDSPREQDLVMTGRLPGQNRSLDPGVTVEVP